MWNGDRRGVKEKDQIGVVKDVVSPSVIDESCGEGESKEVISPSVVEDTVRKENKLSGKRLNFRTLFTPVGNGIDVVVLVESIRTTSERFANPAYSFLLGKRVAYPVVANYHPDENLLKEDVSTIPVWVKLHGVPVTAFSEDGLSAIATKLGTPLMLDSYTADMCMYHGLSTSGKDGSDKGYGTNSLLEQWRDSYPDNDDYYPYDDDMYENHDMSEYLQSICDDLDITNDVLCEQVKEIKKPKKLKGGTKRKRSSRDDQDGKKKKVKKVVGFNMSFNQVETHDFLTDEDIRFLDSKADDAEIEVRLVRPNLQMFMKPMRLKIWNMLDNKNYESELAVVFAVIPSGRTVVTGLTIEFTLGIRATGIYPKYNPKPEKMEDKSDKNEKDNLINLHYPMLTRSNYAAWAIKLRVHLSRDSRGSVVVTGREENGKRRLGNLKDDDMEITDDFAMKVNNIISNIQALGEKVEEAYVVNKQHYLDNMTVEEVIGHVRLTKERDLREGSMKNNKTSQRTLDQVHLISRLEEEAGFREDTNLEDENDLTDKPVRIFEGINDEEFQPTPQTYVHGDKGLSTPTQSPVTYVGSTSPVSSTTSGGALKRYRLLTDLYEECNELLFMQDADEPTSYLTAAKDQEWVKAIKVELDAIEKNQTWSLVDLPAVRKPIGLKWVYKLKRDPSGNILKHKARLIAKGYVQKPRVDFDEVFAPVARIETIRILLALASSHGWKVHHLDVKSAFLHGRLEEEVYVTQPEGYVKANHPAKVYKLSKALYGLRQAPRAWNSRLDKCLKGLNFTRCGLEYPVYTRKQHGNILIVGVYVDDLIVTGNCDGDVKYFKQQMNKEFEMSDMGLLSYYLGIKVTQHEDVITLKQSAYARSVLLKAGMADCNPSQSLRLDGVVRQNSPNTSAPHQLSLSK
ncbi:ribonuclease H-like domain, reverse transcriptase, RNA-dependent DNA polymerase [Tanacetum coccineum]